MVNYQIIAKDVLLDTYNDLPISLNFQITDITDITKRNTNYSKTIIVPGTEKNNRFFNHIFDVNVQTISFNPSKTIPCTITTGLYTIMVGDLQLLNIINTQGRIEYEIVISGFLKNVISEFGDLSLRDLDLSMYNHYRNKTTVLNSWDYTVVENSSDRTYGSPGNGYVYPYIINGGDQDIYNQLYVYNLFPAVYVKTVIDKMFEDVGFTYTSNFFKSDYFLKLILPYVNDKLEMDSNEYDQRTFRVGVDGINEGETTNPLFTQFSAFTTTTPTGYRSPSILVNSQYIYAEAGNLQTWYKNSIYRFNSGYWVPLSKTSGTTGDVVFQDLLNQWSYSSQTIPYASGSSANYPTTFSKYVAQNSGFYDIGFDGNLIMKYIHTDNDDIEFTGGDLRYYGRIVRLRNGVKTIITSTDFPTIFTPSSGSYSSPWYDLANPLTLSMVASNIYVLAGDEYYLEVGFEGFNGEWRGNNQEVLVNPLFPMTNNDIVTNFYVVPSSNNLLGTNDLINMNQVLPDVKQKDFFLTIVKMFNLIIMDNPDIINDLIIEPYDDFYNSKPSIIDWSELLDRSSEIVITPMSELDAQQYTYEYTEDDDYYNKQYTYETKRKYGDFSIEVENDFSDEEKKTELLFAPTPNSQWSIGGRVAPFFVNIEDNTLSSRKVKPRILFYGGKLITNDQYKLKDSIADSGTILNEYAYCGMWDNPYEPKYDLGFGSTDKIYWVNNTFPTNNLIEKFHKNSLLSILDINSKLMTATFKLSPKDIALFDFRNVINIDGVYWRVNRIIDYNPIDETLTKVELLKLTNVNFNVKERSDVPQSNLTCPTDMIIRALKGGNIYESQSGQIITENCCKSLGGVIRNGICYTQKFWDDPWEMDGVSDALAAKVTRGSLNSVPTTQDRTTQMTDGNNTINSAGVKVLGTNNFVDRNVSNTLIVGDSNTILKDTVNAQVVGNNNTVTSELSNVFVFGDSNIVGPDTTISGVTATTLSNVFAVGSGMTVYDSNTIYTQNIVMPAGGTFNGDPITNITGYQYVTEDTTPGSELFDITVPSGGNTASMGIAGSSGINTSWTDGTESFSLNLSTNGSVISATDGTTTNGLTVKTAEVKIDATDGTNISFVDVNSDGTIEINSTGVGNFGKTEYFPNGTIQNISDDGTNFSNVTQIPTSYSTTVSDGTNSITFGLTAISMYINALPAFADDADAGTAGLTIGQMYQTDGTGASPLNVAGIMMIKQ